MSDQQVEKLEKLARLQTRFSDELPARINDIILHWQALREGKNSHDDYLTLHLGVHSLAGSAGTFGFTGISEMAKNIETLVQQFNANPANSELCIDIDAAITGLQQQTLQEPDNPDYTAAKLRQPGATSKDIQLIYVLEDDAILAAEIARQLEHFAFRSRAFMTTTALKAAVAREIPDALLADIHLPDGFGTDASMNIVSDLRSRTGRDLPVIFMSNSGSWKDRLNAVRAGGKAYLQKPVEISLMLDELDIAIGNNAQDTPFRILIVEDTEILAEHYAAVLEASGMTAQRLNNPSQLLNILPDFMPDLILMDIYMPDCNGVEAAGVIRQHADYINLPIVYLSTEKSLDHQLEALRVGGDDFLQKPINDRHLIDAVRIRARRFRTLSALMNRDSLTGLLNHINLKLSLEREIAQMQRRSSLLSFVMLDIDHFKNVNDRYGHPTGDKVIKSLARLLTQSLRKGDIVARYGGEEFAIVLPDTGIVESIKVVDALREQFARLSFNHAGGDFKVTFSAGIASCPAYVKVDQLIGAADKALYKAKHAGRNRVQADQCESAKPDEG